MRAVDVCIHRREAIGKTLRDKRLGRQVVTLVKLVAAKDLKDAGITFQAAGMKRQPIQQMTNASKSALRIFERHASDDSMDFISERKQMLRQIATILTGDAGDQCLFGVQWILISPMIDAVASLAMSGSP